MNDNRDIAADHRDHEHDAHRSHGGHGWMMIACCIPMLVIALALVAAGVVSPGFLLLAVACTVMMAFMMRGMHGGDHTNVDRHH
jgi:hypothetical protein